MYVTYCDTAQQTYVTVPLIPFYSTEIKLMGASEIYQQAQCHDVKQHRTWVDPEGVQGVRTPP